jgi:hypothetical protein
MRVDAYHLPGIESPPTTSWEYDLGGLGSLEVRLPRLTPGLLARQIDALLAARDRVLADRPVKDVIEWIDGAARRFQDDGDELRQSAEMGVAAVTGLSRPMVGLVLDRMSADWRGDRLRNLVVAEFGDPRVIDTFVERAETGHLSRAYGHDLAVHVFSGNVPGVSVTSLIRTLLVGSATLGKTAAGEPLLAALFARALWAEDGDLGSCLAVTYWPGGDEELERCALARAGAVVAYGGREAVEALRMRTPAGAAFVGYGHRVSFGVVGREALGGAEAREVAADAAVAVATFDQQGCVSPHLFYVEEGGEVGPREWAGHLAEAMSALDSDLPRGVVAPGEAAAIRQARGEAEVAQLAGQGYALHASGTGTSWTVIYDPDPRFVPSCLNRLVRVKPVESLNAVAARVSGIRGVLQTVGVAAGVERIERFAEVMGRLGASRVTPIRHMAWPPPTWHHDGRPPLADLVRWCDWER